MARSRTWSFRAMLVMVMFLAPILLLPARGLAQGLPPADPAALGFDVGRLEAVQEMLGRMIESDSLPGAVLMVARHGRLGTARAQGFADLERQIPLRLDHIFRLASATKLFVSAAALSLYEEGALFFEDPVSAVLPE